MKLKIPKIEKSEELFFVSYIIFMFFSVLMHSLYYRYFVGYYKFIVLFCVILLFLKEISHKRISSRSMVGALVMSFITILLVIKGTGNAQLSFACVFVFAYAARNIDFYKICKITLFLTLSLLLLVIISSFLGIIQNYHVIQDGSRHRYFLGFRYALNAPALLVNAIFLHTYIRKEKSKIFDIILFLLASFLLFFATNSRLTFGLSMIGLLISLVIKVRKDNFTKFKKLSFLLIPSYVVCFLISIWLSLNYSESIPWMRELNTIFGSRLKFGRNSLLLYGVKLFGLGNVGWVGNGLDAYGNKSHGSYLYVDNMYIQLLQRYGFVFIILFLILATIVMIQCYKRKDYLLTILFALIALHGLIDDGVLYLQMNTFWLLFGSTAFGYMRRIK